MVQLSTVALAIACVHVLAGCSRALGAVHGGAAKEEIGQHQQHGGFKANLSAVTHVSRGQKKNSGIPQVSVGVNVDISIGGDSDDKFLLVSVDRLLPARENLRDALSCYDSDGNHIVQGQLEIEGLQRHVATLVSSADVAKQLMQQANFRGGDGLDEVEFGTLLDLICWRLNIKIRVALDSGRRVMQCEGTGEGSLQMFGSLQSLTDAHADLDASFHCCDKDGNKKLDKEELDELVDHLRTALLFSNDQIADALEESEWGTDAFGELQFDCLLMLLQEATEQIKLNVD